MPPAPPPPSASGPRALPGRRHRRRADPAPHRPRLGPRGLDLLRSGCTAQEAMAALVASTPDHGWRQMAAIDKAGRTAHFHGARMKPAHAEAHGAGCVAIGNIMANADVPRAMVEAFLAEPEAPLASRLLAALQAGEDAGGEGRPLVSAALVVVEKESFPSWTCAWTATRRPSPPWPGCGATMRRWPRNTCCGRWRRIALSAASGAREGAALWTLPPGWKVHPGPRFEFLEAEEHGARRQYWRLKKAAVTGDP
ncbi:DUF1028 domain-containing protein [Pseudoroseomonas wenyumeiae]